MQLGSDIVAQVAAFYGLRPADIVGSSRFATVTWPRHVAIWLCRGRGISLLDIAGIFSRDHTTVLAATRRVWKELREGTARSKEVLQIQKGGPSESVG